MKEILIEARDLRRSYDQGKVQALCGVSLRVERGEFVSVMGPSGSGKSTLLNVLGALDSEIEGEITIAGADLRHLAEPEQFRARVIDSSFNRSTCCRP